MSTRDEVLASRNSLSEYWIHVQGAENRNFLVSPFEDPKDQDGCNETNSYYLHQPVIAFASAPSSLRRGSKKDGDPICLIHNSYFWREWALQFRSDLGEIMDPRGLVKWEHRSRPDNKTGTNDLALRGYKVRSWRLWGESAGEYHRSVNARRKELREDGLEEPSVFEPAFAEESVKLKWSSPLTRTYQFHYAGVNFFWEGTRDTHANDKWIKALLPFHHLKLMGQIPGQEKLFIGEYVAGFNRKSFGQLWLFDSQIEKLLEASRNVEIPVSDESHKLSEFERDFTSDDVKKSRAFDLIMATSMCMIMGEWQKRSSIKLILYWFLVVGNGMAAFS